MKCFVNLKGGVFFHSQCSFPRRIVFVVVHWVKMGWTDERQVKSDDLSLCFDSSGCHGDAHSTRWDVTPPHSPAHTLNASFFFSAAVENLLPVKLCKVTPKKLKELQGFVFHCIQKVPLQSYKDVFIHLFDKLLFLQKSI